MTRLDSFLYSFQSHQAKVLAFDFESTGVNPYQAKVLGLSLAYRTATGELESEYFPIAHEIPTNEILGWDFPDSDGWEASPDNLELELVLDLMNIIFLDPSILKIAHNAKYDIALGQSHGFEFSEDGIYDTMFASWCLGGHGHGLKALTEKIFGHKMVDYETLTAYKVVRGKSVLRPLARTQIDKVAQYAAEDAFWTYKLWEHFTGVYRDTGSGSQRLFELENSLLTLVVEMERNGILVDTGYLKEFSDILRVEQSFLSQELGAMDVYPGSSQNVAKYFEGAKVDLSKYGSERGKSGVYSVAGGIVQAVADDKGLPAETRRIAGKINRFREISKLLSTYTSAWLASVMKDGYIRATFDQRGAATGRFSCVAGSTLLTTSRGTFRFDSYIPEPGDLVPTHTGVWQPVLAKIFKGYAPMFQVGLSNGNMVECTGQHRVLTPSGWRAVQDLTIGDEVNSYVSQQGVCSRTGKCEGRSVPVFGGQAETGSLGDRQRTGDHGPQCAVYLDQACGCGEVTVGAGSAVLTLEGQGKPYAGQIWRPASRVQGSGQRWEGILATQGQRRICVRAPAHFCQSIGTKRVAKSVQRASHRWQPVQQRPGQPGFGDSQRAYQVAPSIASITSITPVGTMGVWDISVANDHSYLTHGFMNHNSSGPNLQNIPASNFITSTGASYHMRRAIVAPEGFKVVSIDYSQIELRVLAHMSGDQALINAFWANQDVHAATAASLFHIPIEEVTKGQRSVGKTINFAVVYGGGIGVIRRNTGLPWSECEKHFNTFRRLYPGIVQYMDTQTDFATRHGYIETLIGRRVDVGKDSTGYAHRTVAVNSPIQGSAADVIKLAMVSMSGFLRSNREDIRLIMQVHDELVFYIAEDRLAEIVPVVANTMETVVRLLVPVHVDVEYGQNWKDLKDFPYQHAVLERNHVLELV